MVAYSFNRRFVEPIRALTKCGTIRAERKRHARPGEGLQLYTGMRTVSCQLIGLAVCEAVIPIRLVFDRRDPAIEMGGIMLRGLFALDKFARTDGFANWSEMRDFWAVSHPAIGREFSGMIISWNPASFSDAVRP